MVAESIGADQVWAGTPTVPGLSGRGIGVVVIDSGVAEQGHFAALSTLMAPAVRDLHRCFIKPTEKIEGIDVRAGRRRVAA